MRDRIKVVVLGGSALGTPNLFDALGRRGASQAYEFVLFGRDQERLNLVKGISESIVGTYPELDLKITVSREAEEALEGADYCINQIRVGGLEGRAMDETFPRQFGIPGEETVGPGGFNNSLRGIPVILDLCRTIEKVAPNALVLNLTNPSSIIQYAMRKYTVVNVVGTCDSPVSLMELIAKVLGFPAQELQFSLLGSHHFSWVAGVEYQGKEYLPEVLARAEEMPKLGIDPELIRALGVVPSFYLKYYFHPDRILAETEGRTIRAHQLMQLSAQLLEDYRGWKPGVSSGMVVKRGAVWYEKIVGPALLAIAEKQTTELVLSVDNRGSLSWLPDEAIVEVPVKIEAGKITGRRSADLPQNIKAMVAQNCAYEMLAAEAIAEMDRQKAIQALMANHLVTNFNQARGILDLIWPGEQKSQFPVFSPLKKEPTAIDLKVPTLFYGDGMLEQYNPQEEDYALITMEELWEPVKERFTRLPSTVMFIRELDWYILEAMERSLPAVGAVVGLGGGVAQDAAKYIGWRRHIPVDEMVSITSVDASVTKSVAARAGGHVTYIGYVVPRNVYVDYKLIQSAPPRLNRSGVGDILCAHVALWDWKFAHDQTGEAYDPEAVAAMRNWLGRIQNEADQIRNVTRQGIQLVMKAFEEISIICRRFGSSRPQEASDHTFAYNAEFQTGKHFLHGELVALGSWVMASLQDNDPEFLTQTYERTGILWQPKDIGLTRNEFIQTLSTLNWYHKNFGRRYSILDKRLIDIDFIERMVAQLTFSD
jgi:6-phospho-beta-glucosidase